jgi:2-methylisocitrate lyase-like PEP mutase family enzyme
VADQRQTEKAASFRALHGRGLLVLPNAWDAASAALIARAGAQAIATTSAGISWSVGRADGERLARDEMIEQIRRIAAAVDVPVSADVEAGYGPAPDDVAATVEAVISVGAVGINLEDSRAPSGSLLDATEQAERLRAGRAAATHAGLSEFVINARTDVYLLQVGPADGRLNDVLARATAYAAAGADCLFVPGLLDLDTVSRLVQASPLPIAVMAAPGAPTVSKFRSAGVRRLSVGSSISAAAYAFTQAAAVELLTDGTYHRLADALGFAELNALFDA